MESNFIGTLPEINYKDVEKVYKGKINRCMCGCCGDYQYTLHASQPGDLQITEKDFQKIVRKFKKHEVSGIHVIDDYIYIIEIGKVQYAIYKHEYKN